MKIIDKLVKMSKAEWFIIRDLYYPYRSTSHIGYSTLDNYIRWFEKDPKVDHIAVYCLNGEYVDGTFVAIDRYHAFVDTLSETTENLIRLLKLLDYSKGFRIINIRSGLRDAVLEVINSKNLEVEYDEHNTSLLYHLPAEEILKFHVQIPDHIILRPLTEEDAETANELWPHAHGGSKEFLKRLARFNANIGAFTKDGELLAWVFRYQSGPLCALQTINKHYGRGLGTLVTKVALLQIAHLGQDGFAGIIEDNIASRSLFERLGFSVIDRLHWYGVHMPGMAIEF